MHERVRSCWLLRFMSAPIGSTSASFHHPHDYHRYRKHISCSVYGGASVRSAHKCGCLYPWSHRSIASSSCSATCWCGPHVSIASIVTRAISLGRSSVRVSTFSDGGRYDHNYRPFHMSVTLVAGAERHDILIRTTSRNVQLRCKSDEVRCQIVCMSVDAVGCVDIRCCARRQQYLGWMHDLQMVAKALQEHKWS